MIFRREEKRCVLILVLKIKISDQKSVTDTGTTYDFSNL